MDDPKLIEAMASSMFERDNGGGMFSIHQMEEPEDALVYTQLATAALAAIRDAGYATIPVDDMTMLTRGTVREE